MIYILRCQMKLFAYILNICMKNDLLRKRNLVLPGRRIYRQLEKYRHSDCHTSQCEAEKKTIQRR